eukprot:13815925-Alexandrium_andersonii.AAC.1
MRASTSLGSGWRAVRLPWARRSSCRETYLPTVSHTGAHFGSVQCPPGDVTWMATAKPSAQLPFTFIDECVFRA